MGLVGKSETIMQHKYSTLFTWTLVSCNKYPRVHRCSAGVNLNNSLRSKVKKLKNRNIPALNMLEKSKIFSSTLAADISVSIIATRISNSQRHLVTVLQLFT